jgi:hypothetical protein
LARWYAHYSSGGTTYVFRVKNALSLRVDVLVECDVRLAVLAHPDVLVERDVRQDVLPIGSGMMCCPARFASKLVGSSNEVLGKLYSAIASIMRCRAS